MKRWRDDQDFCEWMIATRYGRKTEGAVTPSLSDGAVLYMWEAFQAGKSLSASGTVEILGSIASEIERRESIRRGCGDSRMAPSTASDVSAAIRCALGDT